jgi:hypothetical protein
MGVRALVNVFHPAYTSDFGPAWFGANVLLNGQDPYPLIGPGRWYGLAFYMAYPATTMVSVIPLSFLPERAATLLFVGLSAALLAYGIASTGWFRWPIFLTGAFIDSALAAQWSPLLTAMLCIPALACLVAVKPPFVLPLVAFATSKRTILLAVGGGIVLTAISFVLRPTWVGEWRASLTNWSVTFPIRHVGGFLVLLALLKWRRPEARLLVGMSLMPQTFFWYDTLPLFLIPGSLRESMVLAFTSSLAFALQIGMVQVMTMTGRLGGALIIFSTYLPCLWMVLRRPNVNDKAEPGR